MKIDIFDAKTAHHCSMIGQDHARCVLGMVDQCAPISGDRYTQKPQRGWLNLIYTGRQACLCFYLVLYGWCLVSLGWYVSVFISFFGFIKILLPQVALKLKIGYFNSVA